MQTSEQVESILQVLINATKEIRSYLSEVKSKVDVLIGDLALEEEQKIEQVTPSKLEQILSQNDFSFEVTAQSKTVNYRLDTLIDIKGTNMIISDHDINTFTIRNR